MGFSMNSLPQKFGRISVDDTGITKGWRLFNKGFSVAWDEIEGWATTDVILFNMRTGREEVFESVLELHCRTRLEHITSKETDGRFYRLVDVMRSRLPEKQVESSLEKMQKLRGTTTR
jgi:hypothetical protein